MNLLPILLLAAAFFFVETRATIVVEDATEFSSMDGEVGFSPWTNPADAACSSPLSAASRCFANTETKPLRSSAFSFSLPTPSVAYWVQAEWNVSLGGVPFGGWRVVFVELRWNGNETSRFVPPATPRLEVQDLFLAHRWNVSIGNLSAISVLAAFETGLEDAVFLVSCSKLRANVSETFSPSKTTAEEITLPPASSERGWIASACALAISVPLLIFGSITYRRRRALTRSRLEAGGTNMSALNRSLYLQKNVEIGAYVGATNFSMEYEGTYEGSIWIKCHLLKDERTSSEGFRFLKAVHHMYVMNFMGVHSSSAGLYTIWEASKGIPLGDWLSKHAGPPSVRDLFEFMLRMICALEALHAQNFAHGEVATKNVLIGKDMNFKLLNAGHARKFDVDGYVKKTTPYTPLRWMAPETIKNGVLDVPCDVWGFGIFNYEVFSCGEIPLKATSNFDYKEKVAKGALELEMPIYATKEIWAIAMLCLNHDADKRPKAHELKKSIMMIGPELGYGLGMEDIMLTSENEGKREDF